MFYKFCKQLCLDLTLQSNKAEIQNLVSDYDVINRIRNTKNFTLGSSQSILETSIPVWAPKICAQKFYESKIV